jgi:hypothetical protein
MSIAVSFDITKHFVTVAGGSFLSSACVRSTATSTRNVAYLRPFDVRDVPVTRKRGHGDAPYSIGAEAPSNTRSWRRRGPSNASGSTPRG